MFKGKLTIITRLLGATAVGVLLAAAAGALATPASAAPECKECSSWWDLSSDSFPTNLPPGGEGTILLLAENLGDGSTNGSQIVVTDRLPAGLTAKGINSFVLGEAGECKVAPAEVRCVVSSAITPYTTIKIGIEVQVAQTATSGELNRVTITGGGAPSASIGTPIVVSGAPTPFGFEHYKLQPENVGGSPDTQAGSHPFQMTTDLALNRGGIEAAPPPAVKDLHFDLPPGLIGNPTPFAQCPLSKFLLVPESLCTSNTVVGVVSIDLLLEFGGPQDSFVYTENAPLYNLVPVTGEPARFGFVIANDPVYLDTSVRTGGDYGVTVSVNNITQAANFLGSRVTFWGVPGDAHHDPVRGEGCLRGALSCNALGAITPPPLLTLPTACTAPPHSTVEGDSWQQEGLFTPPYDYTFLDNHGQPVGMDGCNEVPFTPSVKVTPDGQAGSTPTGLTVDEHVPQETSLNPTGLAEADVKGLSVTLPEGVVLNPAGADGLQACSQEQIGLQSAAASSCPEAAKIATAKIKTPLLPNPLEGAAYLATQDANPFGSLVAMYIFVEDPISGIRAKAAGEVVENPVTGQLTAHFEGDPLFGHDPRFAAEPAAQFLPQTPFEDVELHFFGGDRAPLGTPPLCGAYTTTGTFTPWSESATVQSSSTFNVVSGPNGGVCHNPLPFAPTLTAGTTSIQAGGFTPFTMTMSREDGNQNLQSIQLHMPLGLSGTLSTVKLCGEEQANAGACGPESEIGETIVSVGLGGDPFSVRGGKVYITGPYKGAPFGLSIVNPAKAGPFDLGKVVVRAKIDVDPLTAALTITTDTEGPYKIPTIIDGIPLQIKHVNVSIDRPGFTFNPTNCSPLAITGTLGSTEWSTSSLSVPFQVTNCAVLAFKPKLEASTSGKTSRAGGASLTVKLSYPAGPYDANISKVKVELPKALPSRLTTLQKACLAATFEANPANCPAASIVGHATAHTPVLPVPLSGPAYFVSHGNESFPSLIIVLQGYGVTVHLVGSTFISKAGITSSTFKTVPDVPVGTFELTLPQGPYSALAASGNLCTKKLAMPTEFIGQNGALIRTDTKIAVSGCAKHKARHKTKHGARGRKAKGKRATGKHGRRRGGRKA
jgi:hypothetical protein